MDRRQPGVPGAGAVPAIGLEVIEERGDGVGIEIVMSSREGSRPRRVAANRSSSRIVSR